MDAEKGIYIRDFIFGVEDGLVSTLGFVVGLTTAAISNQIIILAGIAEVVAAAVSMAAGTYLSIKSQREFLDAAEGKKKDKHKEQEHLENPIRGAAVMFVAFVIGALFPILPYFFASAKNALAISAIATISALFIFGAAKTRMTKRSWLRSGLEMTIVGLIAAVAGLIVGLLSKRYFGI